MQKTNNNPLNKKQNVVDEIHSIQVADPYRWLEDSNNPEVKEWIKVQNEQTDAVLKNDRFETFSKELVRSFMERSFSSPVPVNGTYFYTERQPDEEQTVLYMKRGLNGELIKLFDPNGKKEGNTVALDGWEPSQTGKYIVYGISEGGDEMSTLYIKNVEKNEELAEKITHCRRFSVRWLPDDSAFFYTRSPRPGTVPKNEEHLHLKVYFHVLGSDPDNDELIFGDGRPKDDMISLSFSLDGRYLAIDVSPKWTENEVYIYDRHTKETRPLVVNIPSKFSIRFLRDRVLIETNYKANNGRVLWATYEDLFKPLDVWQELIPERDFLLQSIRVTKSKILAEYLVNASSEVCIFDYEGKEMGKMPLPTYSSLAGISARRSEEEFFYAVTSFLIPKITYRYDPETANYSEYQKMENPINPDEYGVKQEWFLSKDGTKVPMFIFHRKDLELDGTNPTVLCGYGGFGNSKTPGFMKTWVQWTERGGVFALANIRGGGEFGEMWHKGGIKENKQNSFDDFIAAAGHLISSKYTSAEHLGILGGSNGGLLVSAVGVQRPDLFGAICSRVPLTDMVRFPKFGIALRWIHEYGNPDVAEDLKRILTWSPYHNVKVGVKYPDFFFTTASNDTRVDPLHARKMAAMLQDANPENQALVFTEMDAGHAHGRPITKVVENEALVLSFFAQKLGLKNSTPL